MDKHVTAFLTLDLKQRQSFHESYLSNLKIHPLNELLEVEAANGQAVPYSGFIKADITFPESCFGFEITVPTFSLVVPDMQSSAQSKLLIGTNTLDIVYENCQCFPHIRNLVVAGGGG